MANLLTMLDVFIIITINVLVVLSQISYATDTITKSTSFPDGSILVSKDGTFEMGFFRPGKSSNRYVGIWYKNIPVRRVVWVANRNNPTKDDLSKLIISQDGNLVLLNHNDSLVWSTNASRKASSPVVQLLNSGNLVIRDLKDNNEESFLWQGFDYPCDTLLAGMKCGWNRKLGFVWNMTAWKNEEDPSSGDVIQVMVLTSNPESVILKGSTKIHRTGPWNAPSSGVVGLKPNPLYDFVFVNNDDEVYYRYTLKNSSVISIVIVNQTLAVRQRLLYVPESKTWSVYQTTPLDACDYYNVCGTNAQCIIDGSPMCQCLLGFKPKSPQQWSSMDWTQGCVRSGNWSCGIKNQDGFQKFVGMKFPNTTNSWINRHMTLNDCKIKCLQNCSCTAYTYLDANGAVSGCSIWFGDLIDLRISQSSGQDLYVRMDIDSSNFGK